MTAPSAYVRFKSATRATGLRTILSLPALLFALAAAAQSPVTRVGNHPTFGRVVFEFSGSQPFTTARHQETLELEFPGAGEIPPGDGGARNIVDVRGGAGAATITIDPKARLHIQRMGNRIVVDVQDPIASRPPRAAASFPPKSPAAAPPKQTQAAPEVRREPSKPAPQSPIPAAVDSAPSPDPGPTAVPVAAPIAVPVAPQPAEAIQPAPAANTLALAVSSEPDQPGDAPTALLPFAAGVGAASFRHGEEIWFVFDERRPLDLASLDAGSILTGASVELLQAGTLLRVKPQADGVLRLTRRHAGWEISAPKPPVAIIPSIVPTARDNMLFFPASSPGQVVAVPDPETGSNLLVGTLQNTGGGIAVSAQTPEVAIHPSGQGVVIEPFSDRVALRSVKDGFITDPPIAFSSLPQGSRVLAETGVLTRRFEFPDDTLPNLLRRLQAETQAQAQAPAQSRLEPRKAAAATMLALGLGLEAQALLRLAVTDDPRAADDPVINGLSGIAALLSGRLDEASGLDAPGLGNSDEVTFWRAARAAMADDHSAAAAQSFAATAGLVLGYPTALRNRLLPLAVETMINGGAEKAADAMLANLPTDPALAFARALRAAQKDDVPTALTLFDSLAESRDRLLSARAQVQAALLRLRKGDDTPSQAANALEQSFDRWRGDGRERDLRIRTAALRADAGEWRKAFNLITETSEMYPNDAAVARSLAALLHRFADVDPATIDPLDFVSLIEENVGRLATDPSSAMTAGLIDKLLSMDLPKRADPLLERMALALPPGRDRAIIGLRLATLRLGEGDGGGAAKALAETDAQDLPASLAERRLLQSARASALLGDRDGALAALVGLQTRDADELRVTLFSDKGDWHAAASALEHLATAVVPADGPLTPEQEELLLKLAAAYDKAGDNAGLRALGDKDGGRLSGPRREMFQLLTAPPVRSGPDLQRAQRDLAIAKGMPAMLASIGKR